MTIASHCTHCNGTRTFAGRECPKCGGTGYRAAGVQDDPPERHVDPFPSRRRPTEPNPAHVRIAARLKQAVYEMLVGAKAGNVTPAQREAYRMASDAALSLPGDLYKDAVNEARVSA